MTFVFDGLNLGKATEVGVDLTNDLGETVGTLLSGVHHNRDLVWESRNGPVKLRDLTDDHLANVFAWMVQHGPRKCHELIALLEPLLDQHSKAFRESEVNSLQSLLEMLRDAMIHRDEDPEAPASGYFWRYFDHVEAEIEHRERVEREERRAIEEWQREVRKVIDWNRKFSREFVERELADGPLPAAYMLKAAGKAGIPIYELREAQDALGCERYRLGLGALATEMISLPERPASAKMGVA